MIEEMAGIPTEVDIASEFRYRSPLVGKSDLFIAITQSGETADTLAAMREAKKKGATVIAICNVVGSTASRESEGVVYTHAGPEIGVASTKAFTCQLAVIAALAGPSRTEWRHPPGQLCRSRAEPFSRHQES